MGVHTILVRKYVFFYQCIVVGGPSDMLDSFLRNIAIAGRGQGRRREKRRSVSLVQG